MKRVVPRLTYANVVATLALFLVLAGGTAFAASKLAKNSVGTKQIKNNAVTEAKIKNGAISGAKINLTSLGTVPNATHASSADSATSAGLASNADALGGKAPSAFASAEVIRTASISGTGALDAGRSVGVSQANVTQTGTGAYCINGLNPPPTTAIGDIPIGGAPGSQAFIKVNDPCQVDILTFNGAGSITNEPFVVFLR